METQAKKHSVGGIIFLILSILLAATSPLFFGVIGGGAAVLFAIIAMIFAFSRLKKGGKGKGVVIVSVLSIVLAVIMTITSVSTYKKLHEAALSTGKTPLVAKYLDNPYMGMIGFISNATKSENVESRTASGRDQLSDRAGKGPGHRREVTRPPADGA